MKLISLNTWGGKYFEPLVNFIRDNARNTDIFCFQEIFDTKSSIKQYKGIRANLLEEITKILDHFIVFYFPVLTGFDDQAKPVDFDLNHGPAIFVKKSINVNSQKNYFIYQEKSFKILKEDFSNLATPLQYVSLKFHNKVFSIFNFHGTAYPADKLDSEDRIEQSRKVKEIMDKKAGAKILIGDFNLLPQTNCIKKFEENLRNLIKEYSIQRTRSKLSSFFGKSDFQKFADYTFVSEDINVLDFQVPRVEISDHLPMILEFS